MVKIMTGNYLFPNSYRRIGNWILGLMLVAGVTLTAMGYELGWPSAKVFALYTDEVLGESGWFRMINNEIADEIISVGLIIGALLVAFSKEKVEDEHIATIRLRSLVWATYVNYGILLLSVMLIYGMGFFSIMVYNMFTLLIFFIIRYRWSLYRWKKANTDEE